MQFSPGFDSALFRKLLPGNSKNGLLCKGRVPGKLEWIKAGRAWNSLISPTIPRKMSHAHLLLCTISHSGNRADQTDQARKRNQWVRAWISEAHCQTLAKLQCSSKTKEEAWKQRGGEAIASHNPFLQCFPHTSLVQGQAVAPKTDSQPRQPN